MRIALTAALVLSGVYAAQAEPIEITAVAPASIAVTLWCWRFPDAACRRRAAAAARAHCGAIGTRAQFQYSGLLQRTFTRGQAGYFLYDCVGRRRIAAKVQ